MAADKMPPSEFGGKVRRNRVQPLPHLPTSSEALMLGYTTGSETGQRMPDGGEAFSGLVPEEVQRQRREREGVLEKGQVWDELVQKAQPPTEPEM